jgi:hypothetical protein
MENREVMQASTLPYCVRSATSKMRHGNNFFGYVEHVLIGKEHERIASLDPVTVCTHFFPI